MERNGASYSHGKIDLVGPDYDVFINFQGSDARRGITDILYDFMIDAGIHVLVDDDELHRSELDIGEGLKQAINKCKIFVTVFSNNYASSPWCLKELTTIVDHCRITDPKKIILPVFYGVESRDVKLQTDLYRKALDEHKSQYGIEIVRKWEVALIKVGCIAGWSSNNISSKGKLGRLVVRDVLAKLDGLVVRDVLGKPSMLVQDVSGKLKIRNRSLPEQLIGIEDQVDEIMKLLSCGSPEIQCVVVHGERGIGKTTLASVVFNKISSHFDGCSFISDGREYSQSKGGYSKLLVKLLEDILITQQISWLTNERAHTGGGGRVTSARKGLHGARVLIILDDLDKDQINRLVGSCHLLGLTTRIVITTTDRSVGDGLMIPGNVRSFEMKEIADGHAIQLFSRHAFGKVKPPDDFVVSSELIVRAVRNLPLALEVMGGHLRGETKEVWDHTLQKLQEASDKGIWEFLSMSYQGLNDPEKHIFLDIACFSREVLKREASDMWGNSDNKSALLALAHKSLIKILPGNEIWMHDLLRELGRQMALFKQSHKLNGKHTRSSSLIAIEPKRPKEATPDVSELTSEHGCSASEDSGVVSPGQPLVTLSEDMVIDEGPSTSHAAQTSPEEEDINWEVEMEGGDEESSEALVRSPGKPQLAADELLIGIQHKVEAVVELLNMDSDGVGIIGICGSDGYGKTTLAKAVCREVSLQFEAFCFLEDIRETMLLPHGIRSLQNKLMCDIRKGECGEGAPPSMRFDALSESELPHTKVLIVLDSIKDFSHIKELIGDKLSDRFGRGSRIIVTSGGNHLDVENLGGDWVTIYHISKMNEDSALRLFSQHAFGQDSLIPGYRGIAKTIVSGLKMCPLLIEIVGSSLRGKQSDKFQRMSKSIEPLTQGLQDILKMSYDTLDDTQKQIFLDIACFVGYEDIRAAAYMWHDCLHEYPNRILVPHAKVGKDNRLWMHSSVRRLGREIVRTEGSVIHSGMCSHVFNHEKPMDILTNKEGTQNVEALCLNFGDQPAEELNDQNEELSVKVTAENFKNMPRLRLLELDSAIIIGDFKDVSLTLRWLRWRRCPKDFKATNVNMERLVILDVSGSTIKENWGGWKSIQMTNLKVLKLAHCTGLLTTPPLDAFPELERLILEGCSKLVHIDSTIGVLKCLKFLNLKFCRELRKLPIELGDLEALQELLIDGTGVEEIPEIDKLEDLKILSSADCISLGCIPDSVGKLENLRILSLRGCQRVQKLPDSMQALGRSLVELDISGTSVIELPRSIACLKSLKVLRMESCHITELPITVASLLKLEEIHASCCRNLEDVAYEICELSQLRILELRYAGISGLPKSIKNLGKLEVLDLLHCDKIEQLPKLPSTLKLLHVNPELQPEIQFA